MKALLLALALAGWYTGYVAGQPPAGLALDAGFPVVSTVTTALNGTSSYASSTFSTTGIKTIVVLVANNAFDSPGNPPTLVWTGGTPACASALTAVTSTANDVSYTMSGIWTATTSSNCTNVSVTAGRSNTAGLNDATGIAVFSFSGVSSIGTPVQLNNNGSTPVDFRATLTTTVGSYVVAVSCFDYVSGTSPAGTQTSVFSFKNPNGNEMEAAYTVATGTSTLIGWGSGLTSPWVGFSAVEIR